MDLCQGYTLDLAPPRSDTVTILKEASTSGGSAAADGCSTYDGPSLLGSTYLAAQVSQQRETLSPVSESEM